jgi:hypothetical protein
MQTAWNDANLTCSLTVFSVSSDDAYVMWCALFANVEKNKRSLKRDFECFTGIKIYI